MTPAFDADRGQAPVPVFTASRGMVGERAGLEAMGDLIDAFENGSASR
ncbi:hypothetical protein J1792_33560 [Streptomyces triculaminicus]|uniref:Uncharacterized protein n=2 Tax=Streptomyces TaxID=1883 RepID=A0A939FS56_9ACTN|nr:MULTISPECIES: hypothetical protein [Streptomyces]MBO0657466.1 hypothetical protein [Streptomyces triculaminicus]QSY49584.1 hypothetical protein J3S04_32705 [Streptomyces griseocarneus]